MKTRYITIEREYGSGASEIARRLSEETGFPATGGRFWRRYPRRRIFLWAK